MRGLCFRCEFDPEHPWHDDGTANARDIHLWETGGPHAMPVFNRDEDGNIVG